MKAIELAKATNTSVLFTPVEIPLEVAQPIKSADEPVVSEFKSAPIVAIKPNGEEAQLAEVVTPPPTRNEVAAVSPAHTTAETTLPAIESPLPLMALLGFMILGGVFAVRSITNPFTRGLADLSCGVPLAHRVTGLRKGAACDSELFRCWRR